VRDDIADDFHDRDVAHDPLVDLHATSSGN
jgi:hypothetical protein